MNYQDPNPTSVSATASNAERRAISPERMRRMMIIAGAILFVVAALLVGYKVFMNQMMKSIFASNTPPPVTVNFETLAVGAVPQSLTAIGSVAAVHQVTIAPEISGRITRIAFVAGAPVKKGDVIVQLNDATEQADLASAKAQANLTAATLKRTQELFAKGSVSQAQLDQARSQNDAALAAIDRTQAIIAKKLIKAPFDGVLGVRQVEVGQYLEAGKPIVMLTDMENLYIELTVPEQARPQLSLRQPVSLTVDAYPGRTFQAGIAVIDPQVNVSTRTIRIQALADNSEHLLMPGMFANASIALPTLDGRVTVPETALDYSLYGNAVYVIEDESKDAKGQPAFLAKRRTVKVGESVDGRIVIEEGVKPGERIVTTGLSKLFDGARLTLSTAQTLVKPDAVPVQ